MQRWVRYALFLCTGLPALLNAQGFGIYEQAACPMGRAGTGVAAPCADGSAIFFNPAGLAGFKGGRATVGVTLLDVQGSFTDDLLQQKTNLDDPLLAIPQVYAAYGVTPKLGVGIGLFAPYGLETKWPLTFDGRFAGYDNILRSVYVQPTVAYQVTPWLSLGGGLDIVFGSVELNQRLDLAQAPVPTTLVPVPPGSPPVVFGQFGIAPGTDFANAHLEATKTAVTAHWGAIIKLSDKLSVGGRYMMDATLDYSGTGTFTQVPTNLVIPATITVGSFTIPAGTPVDLLLAAPATSGGLDLFNTVLTTQTVTTSITNPEQLILGLAYKLRKDWTLFGDYQFTRWGKRFSVLNINFANPLLNRVLYENYQNTNGFRFAAEWVKDAKWTFRGGWLNHEGAAPPETVTPLLPEGTRNEFTGGFTVKLSPTFSADVAYQYIKQNDRRGRTREPIFNQVPTTLLNNGLYDFYAHLFGVSLSYAF
ncbi:MAG TPA: outer membrane protein transport protein [Gemmatimonadales bacterium]|nr:outer membrane protein transport protein [Gemmatimonadales bacterium]